MAYALHTPHRVQLLSLEQLIAMTPEQRLAYRMELLKRQRAGEMTGAEYGKAVDLITSAEIKPLLRKLASEDVTSRPKRKPAQGFAAPKPKPEPKRKTKAKSIRSPKLPTYRIQRPPEPPAPYLDAILVVPRAEQPPLELPRPGSTQQPPAPEAIVDLISLAEVRARNEKANPPSADAMHAAFRAANGNFSRAAQALGMHRSTFHYRYTRLRKLEKQLVVPDERTKQCRGGCGRTLSLSYFGNSGRHVACVECKAKGYLDIPVKGP